MSAAIRVVDCLCELIVLRSSLYIDECRCKLQVDLQRRMMFQTREFQWARCCSKDPSRCCHCKRLKLELLSWLNQHKCEHLKRETHERFGRCKFPWGWLERWWHVNQAEWQHWQRLLQLLFCDSIRKKSKRKFQWFYPTRQTDRQRQPLINDCFW